MNPAVLLVEDDRAARELLAELLQSLGSRVCQAADYEQARERLSQGVFDVVVTDLRLGEKSGLDVCDAVRHLQPGLPVIVVTGHGSVDSAVCALRAGAYDFIQKPVVPNLLEAAILRAAERRRLEAALTELQTRVTEKRYGELVGECEPMRRVYDLIGRVADTQASVLICGESGTGKELVARALHRGSERRSRPFVAVNCAAMPAALLESELFGYVKGAFTDARTNRAGLFEQANGGTLFLDEIGEMPPEMQPKLLRVLQERRVRPVGASGEVPVDVRVISATHRDLEEDIEQGRFREDLYYRLDVVQIDLPPLRSRGNDVLLLAGQFMKQKASELGRDITQLSPEAADLLLLYDWPGNVRQLVNCMERAVTLARFDRITPEDLPPKIRGHAASAASSSLDGEHVLPLEAVERRYIEQVLALTKNNKSQAARLLGVDRRTLYRKLELYEKQRHEGDPRGA